ncbi:hypothetical protein EG240_12090 [Paenimyroides tangerinum]|uniref:Uncharacterized protein n=1 Tax=Paenimyroides tangerinum TaxID=2488728 RepID=A0A3P3W5N9_9FLAO|nr:hypothetical protein [Paenimyroides tangerinum]RRJ89296.1 hypothetical protein EG240_12090 [Paenimyroides tangerinum]
MMKNQYNLKIIRYFVWFAPLFMFSSFLIHLFIPVNQGIDVENYTFVLISLIIMFLNCIALLIVTVYDTNKTTKGKIFNRISLFFGTPILFVILFFYGVIFSMQISHEKTKYLRDDCLMKRKNIFISENNYNYSAGYCNTAEQDSIIIVEVYRWGTIRKCGIILDNVYQEIDTSKITFLTENHKKEILSY